MWKYALGSWILVVALMFKYSPKSRPSLTGLAVLLAELNCALPSADLFRNVLPAIEFVPLFDVFNFHVQLKEHMWEKGKYPVGM